MRGKANLIKWLLCVLFLPVTVCTAAAGEVIYVDADADGANDGSSWINAFTDLQNALAAAQDGDEIHVAQGIYTPTQDPLDREATFQLKDGVSILGGYAGFDEPDPNARGVELYETILTGDLAGNDDKVESPSELGPALLVDNSCCVVVADSKNETAVLDGFTITGSYPHRDLCQRDGTMMIKAGNPTVRNCHFTGVGDGTQPWFSRMGGAASLLIQDAAKPIITNCRFTENQSAAVSIDSSPIFTNCIFEDNVYALELWGEDMASLYNSDGNSVIDDEVILTGCTFERTSRTGVSLVLSKITLTDCTFESTKEYSALGVHGGDVTLERCVFNNNTGHDGGAINMADGILVASDCVFTNNRSGAGGAIRFLGTLDLHNCHFRGNYSDLEGGALAGYSEQPVVISGCTFVGNTAEFGGAISYHGPSIVISKCTFADNRGVGPAIFALGGTEQNVEFGHCIIWNGQAPFQPEWWDKWIPPRVEYSDVEGGWPGIGNIDVDPRFANPGYWDPNETPDDPNDDIWIDGDYHLKSQAGRWDPTSESWVIDDVTSPCIDAGDFNSPVAFEPYPNGGVINMGAYGGTAEASKSPSGLHAKYGGGTGEPNEPYLIYTAEQMNNIGAEPNDWDKHFKLMADIDLSGYKGTGFNIIGSGFLPAFTGVFDGNGHTISNFTYTSTGEPCIGIFGYIDDPNARISNLGLIDPNVDGGTGIGVGPLAGWIEMGTITNCYVIGGNVIGKLQVGGLIGTSAGVITDCYAVGHQVMAEGSAGGIVGSSSGSIIGCYTTGNITGSYRVGGLVGSNSGAIVDSYSHASVEGRNVVGGLVGYNNEGIITNCFSTTNVSGNNSTGGLVGENEGYVLNCYCSCTLDAQDQVGGLVGINEGIITASYSSAGIQGRDEIGGLVGYNTYDAEIVNCYVNGDIIGRSYVGGLVGSNATIIQRAGEILSGTIRNCYSVTLVSGDQNVGGLIGYFGDDGVSGSFWDIEASGRTTSDGGVGKTTLEMQDPNTFIDAGWDFVGVPGGPGDIWAEPEGGGYPVLMWQLSPPPELPTFSGGTGEPDDPYLVSTADELNGIGHNPRLMTSDFKLVNDIDLTGVDFYIMASQYYPFRGTFDGDGHTISNFSYTSPDQEFGIDRP
jgi:hypothetical protein